MLKLPKICTTAAFAAVLSVAGLAAQAQSFMTEEELLATIPGSMINGKTDKGVPWAQSYSKYKGGKKSGVIKGVMNDTKFDSKWYVENDQWCENWGDGSACWQVERVDDKSLRMYVNGKARPNLWILK